MKALSAEINSLKKFSDKLTSERVRLRFHYKFVFLLFVILFKDEWIVKLEEMKRTYEDTHIVVTANSKMKEQELHQSILEYKVSFIGIKKVQV